jgi:hypothetical protein
MCAPAPAQPPREARVTGLSPFPPGCIGPAGEGILYFGAEVEPHLAVSPRDPDHLVGAWQQDRWSDGAAAGVRSAFSTDGGHTWMIAPAPFSRCTGGTAANGGDYDRATDPWVSIAPDGTVHQIVLALKESLLLGETSAILASRSTDGGRTWSDPATLIRDGPQFFNDKETITADPADARFVYATWDRLVATGGGPAMFARSTDGGASWETARAIYDPGTRAQTINNQIVVLPDGTLVDFFTLLRRDGAGEIRATLALLRSGDRGLTWSAPVVVAERQSVGTRDPETAREVRDAAILGAIAVGPAGSLVAVWQDARFAHGAHDAIALSRSDDGGLTWSAPVRVNGDPAVAAFVPTVAVSGDGTIGVAYYDFRSNTSDPATLLTDVWLARSADGITWRETRVAGPFDLTAAPFARGLFLGDYAGLVAAGGRFVPFYARVNVGDAADRSDVWSGFGVDGEEGVAKRGEPSEPAEAARASDESGGRAYQASPAPHTEPTSETRRRAQEATLRALDARLPGWAKRGGIAPLSVPR